MGKRHNRKRTRSRPRHRDGNNTDQTVQHFRSNSIDTLSSQSTVISSYQPSHAPIANVSADHWHQTYFSWQNRLRFEQERAKAVESHQLRVFGGEPGDEASLFEPMMKVVTDLFDGYDDFGYP
ncbi:hypothetical protein C7974DRAFT_26087 [Boeremia exigua]|uniref:uncharacterized protein n=1 Tax=Boeremia exigua TaxID=749465 RepID=UPI001E8D2863|nr:uncharacterized protein C7974DRAFT_26087 [Boeremia exigua]KAH6644679.1 hypothetical protein C7974DRAFT_26087 [Boeremia exigua]